MNKVVIASNNLGKLNEIGAILAPLDIEVVPQSVLGIAEAAEPHATFVENALAKARHASRASGLPALADDSGICVRALNGAPGVHSARFAGGAPAGTARDAQDALNNARLLALMARESDRHAHYYCVMVLTRHADDPQPLVCDGEWHGQIAREPRGTGGFGYDALFLIPQLGMTSAELTPAEKNRLSHRGVALAALAARLRATFGVRETTPADPARGRRPRGTDRL